MFIVREKEFTIRRVRDLDTGIMITIESCASFELVATLFSSSCYKREGHEFRFLQSEAREAGLTFLTQVKEPEDF